MAGGLSMFHSTSAELWDTTADDLVTTLDLEHLLQLKTRMGDEKARFDSLDDMARANCVTETRRRLQALTRSDFTATATIVYAVAC